MPSAAAILDTNVFVAAARILEQVRGRTTNDLYSGETSPGKSDYIEDPDVRKFAALSAAARVAAITNEYGRCGGAVRAGGSRCGPGGRP